MKALSMKRSWRTALVCIVIFSAAAAWADAKGHRNQAGRQPHAQGEQGTVLDSIRVTIEKKNLEMVTTTIGDVFYLSDNTIIVHTDGQQVSAREMLIPCEARIGYLTENGKRLAERIDIEQVSAHADKRLTSNRAE